MQVVPAGVLTGALLSVLLIGAAPARAQDVPAMPELRPSIDANDPAAQPPLSAEDAEALGQALLFDPSQLTAGSPAKPLRLPRLPSSTGFDISHTDKPDGSATMVLKQPLAPDTGWDAKVGADLGLAGRSDDGYRIGRPLPVTRDPGDTGAAWASVGVPSVGSVDARVDPSNDRSKVGATLKQSIPLGSRFAVTLQDTYSVTDTYGTQPTAPGDLPLMTVPTAPGPANTPQVWGDEKLAKFDVLSTGTSFSAGVNSTNVDPVTHNKLSAEQKLFGPLHVTTSVSDVGQPVTNKSITAGFKLNW
jgi:hypothetical protein